jgi:hypothetical protein
MEILELGMTRTGLRLMGLVKDTRVIDRESQSAVDRFDAVQWSRNCADSHSQ